MANGGSRAPYIIICNGRIDLTAATNRLERMQVASHCATDLVTYYGERLGYTDTKPISELQHQMMEFIHNNPNRKNADEMVDEMFALLDALEKKMQS